MWLPQRHTTLSLTLITLTLSRGIFSSPLERELVDLQNVTIAERGYSCEQPCGYYTQTCCTWGESCLTNAYSEAYCGTYSTAAYGGGSGGYGGGSGGGHWTYYTTTWCSADEVTHTSVSSRWIAPITVDVTTTTCPPESTETESPPKCPTNKKPCGSMCCGSWQQCLPGGYCGNPGASPSAPVRVTSSGLLIITNTVPVTMTATFEPAIATNSVIAVSAGGSGGLSGGAIAGIVIGVLVGIVILIILCLILCVGAAADGILGFFGLRSRRRRRRETVEVQEYHDHGSRTSSRRWNGRRKEEKKRFGGWGGFAAIGGTLVALAAALGMKRRYDRKRREEEKTDVSYYSYSDYSSQCKSLTNIQNTNEANIFAASDRRTRDTPPRGGRNGRR